ncbi:MAG TPA: hypothetical protein VKW77_08525, partial [Acidimicrobiales bacterium]|nr:hypothetical protein [Acidimicrobiales bacterium]
MSEEPDPKSNRRRQRRRLLQRTRGGLGLGAAAIGLAACSGAAGSASSSTVPRSPTAGGASAGPVRAAGLGGAVTTYEVPPSATAPGLGSPSAPDLAALDPAVRSNGELFVFLPGTGGSPDCCLQLLETAARTGFLAVGLTYENTEAVGRICRNDLSCYGTVRQDDF